MKLLLAASAVAAIASASPALAQAVAPGAQAAPAMKAMSRADLSQMVQQRFAQADANRDGFVTQAEAKALAGQRPQRMQQRAARGGEGGGKRAQRRDPAAMFTRLDTNSDGVISRAEFDSVRGQGRQRMAQKGAMRARAFGGRMFAMADTDKDGRISLQEATAATMKRFDSADANRDGVVTREERQQRRQQRRGAAPRG